MTSIITAAVFLAFALAILIFLLIGKGPLKGSRYLNFFRASCGVYVSGSVLVLVFTLLMKQLPVAFVVISNITILFVFLFTVGLIFFMTRSIVEASKKAENKIDDEKKD